MTERRRLILRSALAAYVLFLAFVVFQPVPSTAIGVVGGLHQFLVDLGVPATFTAPGRVEFLLNALMFAPITLLGYLSLGHRHWANWVVYAFVGSLSVEFVQGVVLPYRSAQFVDVVSNTLGGLLGAVAGLVIRRLANGKTSV